MTGFRYPSKSSRADRSRRRWAFAFCVLLAGSAAGIVAVAAAEADQSRIVDGLAVYLGVLPSELIAGHLPGHPEEAMHGGVPAGRDSHHVLVAVFDAASGARLGDLDVEARISELGLAGTRKALEPMAIADTVTYGNYFKMPAGRQYRIAVDIHRPGASGPLRAEFSYEHRLR